MDIRKRFKVEVGLSDHTPGIGAAVAAVAYGASIIEKHFTLSRKDGGLDDSFSINPDELYSLVQETKRAWASIGKKFYGILNSRKVQFLYLKDQFILQRKLKKENYLQKIISK